MNASIFKERSKRVLMYAFLIVMSFLSVFPLYWCFISAFNTTQEVLEKRLAALEGGSAALAVSSGAAAISYTIEALAANGEHIVAQKTIYGGTFNLLAHTLPLLGIETTFIDAHNLREVFPGEIISRMGPHIQVADAKIHGIGPAFHSGGEATEVACRSHDFQFSAIHYLARPTSPLAKRFKASMPSWDRPAWDALSMASRLSRAISSRAAWAMPTLL